MASRIILCSSVRPWALIRPGIMEWPQSKIHGRVPHPLERGLERLFRRNHRDEEAWVAEGYEFERRCGLEEGEAEWTERVVVVRAPAHAERQTAGLETRLATAEQKLAALTPARGRGKRQSTEEAQLVAALAKVLKAQQVEGLLQVAWQQQIERHTHYVGRGTRLGHASTAGHGAYLLSPHPPHPPGRPHGRPPRTLWLE